ncbi:MAG: hypothetical protein ABEJ85_04360 [Haloarculaceae archaeon]
MVRRGARRDSAAPSERAQSEVLGVVLLMAITITGTTAIVAFGVTALSDSRASTRTSGVEHAMAQLDSRISLVALGNSDVQSVDFPNPGDARYEVRPDAGWVNVTHRNYDDTGGVEVETIVNASLGAVVYETGDSEIAYQAGGVWRYADNGSVMLSPPEFHYRDSTLTFPLIEVDGNASVSGTATVTAEIRKRSRRLFPDGSASYPDGDPYLNPIEQGNVSITLHSTYYQAWADYFERRTGGAVTVHHNNDTVVVELVARGTLGDFEMPAEGNAISVRGLGSAHTVMDFSLTLIDDDGDAANFNNLKWSMYADESNQRLEFHLRDGSGSTCPGGDAELHVYYANNSGANYESWYNESAYQYECESNTGIDYNDDGDNSDVRLVANLTAATDIEFEPIKSGGDAQIMHFSVSGSDNYVDPTTWDEHTSVPLEPVTFDDGGAETTSINDVTNHYLSLMSPSLDLQVDDKGGNTVNEGASSGTFQQAGGSDGGFLTFLHITENEVEIEIS